MILHIDMDAFFAAVEQRDNPALRHRPVIVAGNSKRSVVSTASYEARKFGIRSAMPVYAAKQRCADLIVVPGNMKKYRSDSKKIMAILSGFSPLVEQVSIDEAFVDLAGCERLFGSPEDMGRAIKKKIEAGLSLTSSIGIAPIKFLAKIASDMNKPDGLTLITPAEAPRVLAELPIQKVPGVGQAAMKQMNILKIRSLGDIKKFSLPLLTQKFGKMGPHLFELSNGIDASMVETGHTRKSISSETTLSKDVSDFETLKGILLDRAQTVGRDLRAKHLVCETVFIKLKFSDFTQVTRSRTLDTAVSSSAAIFKEALALYRKIELKKKIRLAGVGVTSLKDKDRPIQMFLLGEEKKTETQWASVDKAVDSIMEKFGGNIIQKASLKELFDEGGCDGKEDSDQG
ncbi:MAG: DNA polymerase IV [Desulfobacula sp.]|nr:DNA polymerase IV [Desulfobacula sp.]